MNLAIMHYRTKYGTDSILFRTNCNLVNQLPEITDDLLEAAGIEIEDGEEVEWYDVRPINQLPEVNPQ